MLVCSVVSGVVEIVGLICMGVFTKVPRIYYMEQGNLNIN